MLLILYKPNTNVGPKEDRFRQASVLVHVHASKIFWIGVKVMVFNATFNNISVILWRSVLLVEETGVSEENHLPVTNQ